MKLKDICKFVNEKVDTSSFHLEDYVSTENLLPNKGGVTVASKIPQGKATLFKKGDILISNIRPYFKKIYLAKKQGCCSNDVLCIRPNSNIPSSYLYYLLSQDSFFDYVMTGAKGTKMPRGDKGHIMNWAVYQSTLSQQQNIAEILTPLDDKIAVNSRICANLEAQAQALFKSWFVDFTPFKDQPFVDSELGPIPQGWKVGKADDFYKINIGKTPPRKEKEWFSKNESDNKWISISDMGNCGLFISNSAEKLTNAAIKKFNISLVPVNTILLSFKLTIGRVAISDCDLTTNEAIARFILPDECYLEFSFLMLKLYNYSTLGSTSSIATAVNSKIIKSMKMVMPSLKVLEDFHTITNPLFEKIRFTQKENQRLAALRDTLLPKLMSGEIKL